MFKIIQKSILNLLTILSVLTLGLSGAAALGIVKPMVVTSGSMEPTIQTGSFILAKKTPVDKLSINDIASLPRNDGVIVTHRITSIDTIDDKFVVKMKGDANTVEDSDPYIAETALTPMIVIPGLGSLVAKLVNSKLIILGVASFAFAFMTIMSIDFKKTPKTIDRKQLHGRRFKLEETT